MLFYLLLETEKIMDWIEVKDGKPHTGQNVLCVQDPHKTATREALFATFNGEKFEPPKGNCIRGEYSSTWCDITHWMPLPKTPKQ